MITGADLAKLFKQGIDEPYTGYYDNFKLNRLFKKAIIRRLQEIYLARLDNQNAFDQIGYLIAVDKSFNLKWVYDRSVLFYKPLPVVSFNGNGSITSIVFAVKHYLAGDTIRLKGLDPALDGQYVAIPVTETMIHVISPFTGSGNTGVAIPQYCVEDYEHFLWAEAEFEKELDEKIVNITTDVVFVQFDLATELRDYDRIRMINGLTGYAYIKQHNEYMVELYADSKLSVKYVIPQGQDPANTVIKRIVNSTVRFMPSDEKGMAYGRPSTDNPVFQQGELAIFIKPAAVRLKMDYIKKLPQDIDVNDDVNDLERFYPYYFLIGVVDTAVKLASMQMRDMPMTQLATEQIVNNP